MPCVRPSVLTAVARITARMLSPSRSAAAHTLDQNHIDGLAARIAVGGSVERPALACRREQALVMQRHPRRRREHEAGTTHKRAVALPVADGRASQV